MPTSFFPSFPFVVVAVIVGLGIHFLSNYRNGERPHNSGGGGSHGGGNYNNSIGWNDSDSRSDTVGTQRRRKPEDEKGVTCVICCDTSDGSRKTLLCSHIFHADCINKWLSRNPHCPLCKTPVRNMY